MTRRRDPVDPQDAIAVILRDEGCVAPLIDPAERGMCWGRPTIDHVKKQPRMGVRAESRLDRMVAVCEGHSETGMKGGRQWNTANREAQREYLRRVTA